MDTGISIQDLHKYNALYSNRLFTPDDCSHILGTVLEDDIDKTNRIAMLLQAVEKASKDYKDLLERYEALQQKDQKEEENNKLGRRGTYGIKSEKLTQNELATGVPQSDIDDLTDPLSEDEPAMDSSASSGEAAASNESEDTSTAQETGKNKKKVLSEAAKKKMARKSGVWKKRTAGMKHVYVYDVQGLDLSRINDPEYLSKVRFDRSEKLGFCQPQVYVLVTLTAAIAYSEEADDPENPNPEKHALERKICRPVTEGYIMPGSRATPELMAEIFYLLTVMYLPYTRIEKFFSRLGYPLVKQTINYWSNQCALRYLLQVYDAFTSYIMEHKYIQMDETTWQSVYNAASPGAKSYIWLLTTSELLDGPKAVVYFFNPSRKEEFLEDLFEDYLPQNEVDTVYAVLHDDEQEQNEESAAEGSTTEKAQIVIKDDAYGAYPELEKHSHGSIAVSFCLAHLRRYFYLAWLILKSAFGRKELSPEDKKKLAESWEWKILYEISKAESEDTKLKHLSREERLAGRISNVKPHLDKAYEYVCSYDKAYKDSVAAHPDDPSKRVQMSVTMQKAMKYFKDVKKDNHIDSFLYDPDIPADNSFCERSVKPLALQRRNSLFSYSNEGARCRMIANSVAQTATLNNADPWYYFLYLLREMPKHQKRGDDPAEYLPTMMPWSDQYKDFEQQEKALQFSGSMLGIESESEPTLVHGVWVRNDEAC